MNLSIVIQLLAVLIWTAGYGTHEGVAQVAVIAHKSVPEEQISKGSLYDMYAFEVREWQNGQPVVLFDLKEQGDLRAAFYAFLGKSPSRMKSIWLVHKLSGEGDPPEALDSVSAMINRVAETPGAIGFVRMPVENDQVKILAVIEEGS